MELTKHDNQIAKGIAIIGMVMLHPFSRLGELPYSPLIWIGKTPLIFYVGLLGDMCVSIFCFCSGYAHFLLNDKLGEEYKKTDSRKIGTIYVQLLDRTDFVCNNRFIIRQAGCNSEVD